MSIDENWKTATQHLDARRPDQAFAVIQRMLEEQPGHDLTHCALGLYHVACGNLVEASASFEKAAGINPENLDARVYLALAVRKEGTAEAHIKCRDMLMKLIETFPGAASSHKLTNFILKTAAECCEKVGPASDGAKLWKALAERTGLAEHQERFRQAETRAAQPGQSDNDLGASHIVCFAPYADWTLHGARKVTLLHALLVRGCTVSAVLCDGVFSDCDKHRYTTGGALERPANACVNCQAWTATDFANWGMPFRWLGRWLRDSDFTTAAAWVASVPPQSYREAVWRGRPVGEWVQSSVHTHFRYSVLDLSEPHIARVYASYLNSAVLAALALSRLYENEKPDVQLIMNGRMAVQRVALEIAKEHGIRTICEERGQVIDRMMLFDNESCVDLSHLTDLWKAWRDVPLTGEEIAELDGVLSRRREGKSGQLVISPPIGQTMQLLADLGLDASRPVWALYPSSMDEVASHSTFAGAFPTQEDWIEASIAYFKRNPHLQLVIRVHPHTGSNTSTLRSNEQELAYFAALGKDLPPNVHLVESKSSVSSYTLATAAQVGLIWHSTLGMEMAALGRTVIRVGSGWYTGTSFTRHVADAATYEATLDEAAWQPEITMDAIIAAWRFSYLYLVRRSHRFPFVETYDWFRGRLNYKSLEELAPGKNATLDKICDAIMNGTTIYPVPENRAQDVLSKERDAIGRKVATAAQPN